MSMVTVHGPNTMYTTGGGIPVASSPAGATATQSNTNGLVYNFAFTNPAARPAADFDWTFTGPGAPAAQADKTSGTVTFTGPGAVTIVCTVSGATAPPPTNGVYTISGTAVAGAPRMEEGGPAETQQALEAPSVDQTGPYDPGEFTVAEVVAYATDNPEEVQSIIDAEEAGRSRTTLLNQLRAML